MRPENIKNEDLDNNTTEIPEAELTNEEEETHEGDPRAELPTFSQIIQMVESGAEKHKEEIVKALSLWQRQFPSHPGVVTDLNGFSRDFKAACMRNGVMAMFAYFEQQGERQMHFRTGGASQTLEMFQQMFNQAINDNVQRALSQLSHTPRGNPVPNKPPLELDKK